MQIKPEQLSNLATKDDITALQTKLESRIDKLQDEILTGIDGLAKIVTDFQAELAALKSKVDRHEKWIEQIAQHLHIKLNDVA